MQFSNTNWPVELSSAIYEALERRIAPKESSIYLKDLVKVLIDALERGEIYIDLLSNPHPKDIEGSGWPERHKQVIKDSGWIEGDSSPMILEGNILSWRKWNSDLKATINELVKRSKVKNQFAKTLAESTINYGFEKLNKEQKQAIQAIRNQNIILLSGGPGTGKTSTIVQMIRNALYLHPGISIGLAAPTGKATRRLRESVEQTLNTIPSKERGDLVNLPCRTLHRWLEASPRGFLRNKEIPLNLDLLVIDEMSMVDLPLMKGLLSALPEKSQLIMVGDPAQLPPVGSGAIWHELQKNKILSRFGKGAIQLQKVYRNRGYLASISNILREQGIKDFWKESSLAPKSSNFEVHYCDSNELPKILIQNLVVHSKQIKSVTQDFLKNIDPINKEDLPLIPLDQLMVLCPRRRGLWGVDQVHRKLLGESLNQGIANWPEGIPVMCCENQPEIGLANGDIGMIVGEGEMRRLLFQIISKEGSIAIKLIHPARLRKVEPAHLLKR